MTHHDHHQITIRNTGHRFTANPDETILEAALREGLILPYGCRDGACGSCKGKLIEGSIDYGKYSNKALTETEREAGMALFCQALPLSDLVIEAREVRKAGDIQIRTLPCRVQRIERPDRRRSHPVPEAAHERAVAVPCRAVSGHPAQGRHTPQLLDGECAARRRTAAAACAPRGRRRVHRPRLQQDEGARHPALRGAARYVLPARRQRQSPSCSWQAAPVLRPSSRSSKAALAKGITRPMTLYWGGRRPRDLYLPDLPQKWAGGARRLPVHSRDLRRAAPRTTGPGARASCTAQ